MAPQSPGTQPRQPRASLRSTYLFLLLVEVVNDDADEKVQGEERPENNEHDEVDVHVEVVFPLGLLFILKGEKSDEALDRQEWARAAGVSSLGKRVCSEEGHQHRSVSTEQGQGGVGVAGEESRHAGLRADTASLHGFCPWATGRFENMGHLSLQRTVSVIGWVRRKDRKEA